MFDFILSYILKSTVVLFILTGYLNHNYLKQKQEGHLKQQVSEEVDYSNALWRRDYDRSLEADPHISEVFFSEEKVQVYSQWKTFGRASYHSYERMNV